jgi:hypothetical protein
MQPRWPVEVTSTVPDPSKPAAKPDHAERVEDPIRTGAPTYNQKEGIPMTLFMVQVRIKQDRVAEVEAGIRMMMSALDQEARQGVRYVYGKLPDGVSFVALLELADGTHNPLPDIAAAREFQQNLAQHWMDQSEPAAPQQLQIIGSYRLFA